jgi:hypothetical protein
MQKQITIVAIDRTRTPDDIKALSTKKIGSIFTRNGDVLRGLSMEEEKFYMPEIVSLPVTDMGFQKACKSFWTEMSMIPDAEEGTIVLEVGGETQTVKDHNGKEVEMFMPNNLFHWLQYRWIQKHPKVAFTKEELEAKDNTKYTFFVKDQETIKKDNIVSLATKMKADKFFLTLFSKTADGKVNEDKINWIIDMYKGLPDPNAKDDALTPYNLTDISDKELFLYEKKSNNPDQFVKVMSDELLEEKATVTRFVEVGVLQRIGNTYVNDQTPIGESLNEAAMFIKNPKNSKVVLTLTEQAKALA